MKRKFLLALSCSLLVSLNMQTITSFAYASNNPKISVSSEENKKADLLLKTNFSESELKRLEAERAKQDKIELENGFTKRTTEVIVPSHNNTQSDPLATSLRKIYDGKTYIGDGIYYLDVVDTYTGNEEVLNKRSHGMAYYLDIVWNLAIGSKTKYAWKATTLFGINPSNYLNSYVQGDKLSSTKTKVVHRRCYKKYNPIDNMDNWYFETKQVTIKNYVDLYTFDKYNRSVRESTTDKAVFYSKYFYNDSFIKKTVNNYLKMNYQVPYIDEIE